MTVIKKNIELKYRHTYAHIKSNVYLHNKFHFIMTLTRSRTKQLHSFDVC